MTIAKNRSIMIGVRSRSMILIVACSLLMVSVSKAMTTEGTDGSCMAQLKNIAEYEGALNTLIHYPADPNDVDWMYRPRTGDQESFTIIVNGDDTVRPNFVADYAYTYSSGLTIKNATTTAEPGHQEPTAGLYGVYCYHLSTFINFQFLVVRQGPTCSCTSVDSSSVQLTCSSIYALGELCPIYAVFTLYADGIEFATEQPARAYDDSNKVYSSTSTITSAYSDSSNYECGQTFSPPMDCTDYVVNNAPNFNQRCSFACPITTTDDTTTTTQPPTTTTPQPLTTAQPSTSTTKSLTQTQSSTTIFRSPPPDEDCNRTRECQPDGTDLTGIYIQRVVKAQLYTRSDKCCPNNQTCGVVVTLRNDNRYLIHDAVCNDNSLNMAVVAASCMSSDWNWASEKRIRLSNVGAFVIAGNIAQIGSNIIPVIQSCNVMMSLP